MLISTTAEYALRAMVWLARDPSTPQTTETIAKGTQVPKGYLSKVLQSLGKVGLVRSQRGLGGGFTLSRAPRLVSALDVVQAVDPPGRITRCPLGMREHRLKLCPLHERLDHATALVERAFAKTSLADLTSERAR